jgi:peptidoglycan/LPS O-acetylase OafA/YrhL
MTEGTTELRALTSARGIAAWLVVLYHIRGSIAGLPAGVAAVLAKGYLAVDFFFLLSGFVIWLTWHDRLRAPGAAVRFLQKRIARIWPLHAAMLAFAVALALLLAATGRHDPAFPFAELPLHVLLLQNWGFTDALRWNDPAWSISCELAAYLLFPLLVLTVDWRRLPIVALIGIAGGVMLVLYGAMRGATALGDNIPRYGLIRCLCEFTVGTILAAGLLRTHDILAGAARRARWTLPVVACATVAAVIAWCLGTPETLAAPVTFAGLLLALALTSGQIGHPLEGRAIHYLGDISYATYLSHFLLWKAFRLPLAGATLSPLVIACYLGLVLVASIALYHGVERPAQRRINALSIRRRRVAPAE